MKAEEFNHVLVSSTSASVSGNTYVYNSYEKNNEEFDQSLQEALELMRQSNDLSVSANDCLEVAVNSYYKLFYMQIFLLVIVCGALIAFLVFSRFF